MPETSTFEPGSYWTHERGRRALEQMIVARDTLAALVSQIAEAATEDGDPAAAAARLAPSTEGLPALTSPVAPASCVFRRGRASDIPALVALIASGDLPPLFIEQYVDGFLVVEHEGRIVACGGVEPYGPDAVIRSVVVDAATRGTGLGLEVARLLEEDAVRSGGGDVYLFTMHAHGFWKRLGYVDLPLDRWAEPVRESWQYRFIVDYPEASRDVFAMVKQR